MQFCSFSIFLASILHVAAAADNPTFMMVSVITAAGEMCLTTGALMVGPSFDATVALVRMVGLGFAATVERLRAKRYLFR